MSDQNNNPFDNFQPSWLKAKNPSSGPARIEPVPDPKTETAEDILWQEVIAPLQNPPTPPALTSATTHEQPIDNVARPTTDANNPYPPFFDYKPAPPVKDNPDTAISSSAASPEVLRTELTADRPYKSASRRKNNWLLWLLAVVGLIVIAVLAYAVLLAAQGGERQANRQPAQDVGDLPHYPNSYLLNLNPDQIKPFESQATFALTKINKEGCFSSPDNIATIQQFYENQLPAKKYSPLGQVGNSSPQTEAWSVSGKTNIGAVMSINNIGYLDFGYFNRVEPSQSVFCLFSGSPVITATTSGSATATPSPKAEQTQVAPPTLPSPIAVPTFGGGKLPTNPPILPTSPAQNTPENPATPIPNPNSPPPTPTIFTLR